MKIVKIGLAVAAMMIAAVSSADYMLTWALDEDSVPSWVPSYNYAALAVKTAGSSDYSYLKASDGSTSLYTKESSTAVIADVSSYYTVADSLFYSVYLYNITDSSYDVVANGAWLSFTDILSYVYENGTIADQQARAYPVSFTIPEPTSALLLLVGCALLTLRRRR